MYNIVYSKNPPQTSSAISSPGTSQTQRPKAQVPMKGSFHNSTYPELGQTHPASLATPPTSSPAPRYDTEAHQKPAAKRTDLTQYTLDDGARDEPGTAAYYKSWAFRRKVKEGTTVVPGQEIDVGEDVDDSADENYIKKPRRTGKGESMIMIFSRTSVRRARTQRKVTERMQRSNRRTKFKRKLEKTRSLFGWD